MALNNNTPFPVDPANRLRVLTDERNRKMARSAHAYVRGNTKQFYAWLDACQPSSLPEGPPVWICGDCHLGNLGPIANSQGDVEIQIRDLDQTVIGNPAHDIIRLGLSLAMAARSSDLPGITTALMMERLIEGYTDAFAEAGNRATRDRRRRPIVPATIAPLLSTAAGRSWRHLARERLGNPAPDIPVGRRFWNLTKDEDEAVGKLFEKRSVSRLATLLSSTSEDSRVTVMDAAYWMKGCSSLGRVRYAVVLGVGKSAATREFCLMDLKEAVPAAAPAYRDATMPRDHAARVVEGARHLSPHLGDRMLAADLLGKSIVLRELMPQDMKLEFEQLSQDDACQIAGYLAHVVGRAHGRQMDKETAAKWLAELRKYRSKTLDAPSWLWNSVVDLVASHEAGYLQHCRRNALKLA